MYKLQNIKWNNDVATITVEMRVMIVIVVGDKLCDACFIRGMNFQMISAILSTSAIVDGSKLSLHTMHQEDALCGNVFVTVFVQGVLLRIYSCHVKS